VKVLALSALLLLGACSSAGSPGSGSGRVASLVSVAPPASASSPAPPQRPLIRPDTSDEEEDRLNEIFFRCMVDHGDPDYTAKDKAAKGLDPGQVERDPAATRKALAACENKEPETLWQRSKRLDPDYGDKLRDWITCIRSHGIDAFEEDGMLAYESLPPENQLDQVDACEQKVFAAAG
jgi:hypothetical protein